jgi:methyl-accepting chemotaxis protein
MIQRLQEGAKAAVSAVNESKQSSVKTKEQAAAANVSLDEVTRLMNKVLEGNTQIAEATMQQSQAAHEIASRVNVLSTMAEESLQTATNLNQSSKELDINGNQMKKTISQFKI